MLIPFHICSSQAIGGCVAALLLFLIYCVPSLPLTS